MDTTYLGVCHTFVFPNRTYKDRNHSMFYLNPGLSYRILIHDPKFYLSIIKSGLFPRIWIQYKAGQNMEAGTFEVFEITITEHHLLNRPEQPCEEEEDYDFLQCVKTSQARMVGCRPPWDIWSPPTLPLCQTMDQLLEYEKIDRALFMITRKKEFLEQTGCKLPCHYQVGSHLYVVFFSKMYNLTPGIQQERRS